MSNPSTEETADQMDEGEEDSSSSESLSDTLTAEEAKELSNTLKSLEQDISYFDDYKRVNMSQRAENSFKT